MAIAPRCMGPGWPGAALVCAMLAVPHPAGSTAVADAPAAPAVRGAAHVATAGDASLGQRLFLGTVPLQASLRGDAAILPVAASRCINCHSTPALRPVDDRDRVPGPGTASALLASASRRGGPVFAYDATSLCTTLRTGVDPQQIWLARAMPQFRLTPRQCAALWAYLTQDVP